jgi:CDP-4-dehydro-6-deoxyglucose reductase
MHGNMNVPKPQRYTVKILKKEKLTDTVLLCTFRTITPDSLVFTPGQYASFIIDEKTRRQYSFCSAPKDPSRFEIAIDTSPMGPGSKFFLSINEGDQPVCIAPLGTFVFDVQSFRKKVLIATGTGIAPFRSMVIDYLTRGGTDDITLYWGMRHESDLYWVGEFQELSVKYPNFRFILTLSKPLDSWQGKRGRVTAHVSQEEQNPAGS